LTIVGSIDKCPYEVTFKRESAHFVRLKLIVRNDESSITKTLRNSGDFRPKKVSDVRPSTPKTTIATKTHEGPGREQPDLVCGLEGFIFVIEHLFEVYRLDVDTIPKVRTTAFTKRRRRVTLLVVNGKAKVRTDGGVLIN